DLAKRRRRIAGVGELDEECAERSGAGRDPRPADECLEPEAAERIAVELERLTGAPRGVRDRGEVACGANGGEEPGRGASVEHAATMRGRRTTAGIELARAVSDSRERRAQNALGPATCWQQMTGYPTRRWKRQWLPMTWTESRAGWFPVDATLTS